MEMSDEDDSPRKPRKLRGIPRPLSVSIEGPPAREPPLAETPPAETVVPPVDGHGFPFLSYCPRLQLLLCQRCQHAVAGDQLRAHMNTFHPESLRHGIASAFQYYTNLDLAPRQAIALLRGPRPWIPGLSYSLTGLQCLQCPRSVLSAPYICLTANTMRKHLQEVHPETRRSGRGRPRKGQQSPAAQLSREGVPCQRLFISGSGSLYFEALPPPTSPGRSGGGAGAVRRGVRPAENGPNLAGGTPRLARHPHDRPFKTAGSQSLATAH